MKIITFYSYKGGVGRTMCLANIAVLLAKWGHKVLMVDWDWEAPGLERYFIAKNFNGKTNSSTPAGIDLNIVKEKPGLVDLLTERKKDGWKEALIEIPIPDAREPLHFISAGRRDDDYFKRVRDFNVDTFYAKKKGGQFIEDLRKAWRDAYDFILIDSRTGVSEINGISTIQMPNLVVLLFTATNQSFEGALDIAYRSASAHQKLPYDRGQLLFLPLLSRVEVAVGHLTDEWIARFSKDLEPLYQPWLPTENPNIKINEFMMRTKIPHDPFYTFGEELAVVRDGTVDPARMGYAYEGIASLIANKLQRVEEFVERREAFVKSVGEGGDSLVQKVEELIKSDQMHKALALLETFFKANYQQKELNEVIIMNGYFNRVQEGFTRGQIDGHEFFFHLNLIAKDILNVSNSIEKRS
jgi:cellulose biosynthesis protein BcsQ